MNPISKAYWIGKGIGWDNVPRRVLYLLAKKSGRLRRVTNPADYAPHQCPNAQLTDEERREQWRSRQACYLPIPDAEQLRKIVPAETWEQEVTSVCRQALEGQYPFFSRWTGDLGWPPNFNLDPVNDIQWPNDKHWTETTRSGPPRDDIKLVWEASRFSLAYYLARQYAYSREECWAEAYWEMLESWVEQNPPQESVAWGCGQEIAFRVMAILTATCTVLKSSSTSAKRLQLVDTLMWQSAKHIAANINYAISQENNHAFSEAVGLLAIGLLYPRFPESHQWLQQGKQVLESEIKRQVYSDGSYVQHSMSYHRVMLDDLSWALALLRQNGQELSQDAIGLFRKATQWCTQFVDSREGRVPNYGANDGANVLPLSCSDYLDYRPALHAASQLCGIQSGFGIGPWVEKTLWLTGEIDDQETAQQDNPYWSAPIGGYHILRGNNSHAFVRAATFRDRPSQCDQLHLDLWFNGHNLLRDAGSYHYYHRDAKLKHYFYSVEAHNTIQLDSLEQMQKGPGFLWLRWPSATAYYTEQMLTCRAEFQTLPAYTHHRRVQRNANEFRILDQLESPEKGFTLRWRLAPEFVWQEDSASRHFRLETQIDGQMYGLRIHSEDPFQPKMTEGWESLYYGEKTRIPVLEIYVAGARIETVVGPQGALQTS